LQKEVPEEVAQRAAFFDPHPPRGGIEHNICVAHDNKKPAQGGLLE